MIRKHFLLLCASAVLLGACGENKKTSDSSQASDSNTNAKTTVSIPGDKAVASTIMVTIKNGPHAETYQAQCKETCTSYGIAGAKVFGNQYSDTGKGPKKLSSVQLLVTDVAGDKQTKDFSLTVGFGDLLSSNGNSYTINNLSGIHEGSGTLDLKYTTEKANVKIEATAKDGTQMEVTIDADKVMTANNLGQ
jgi:hypothetical protein